MDITTNDERTYSVYMHTNKVNGKKYIGITSQKPYKRWCGGHGYYGCRHFYNAIQKYGWKNFSHDILETGLTKADAEQHEKDLIQLYDTTNYEHGYNISIGGEGVNILQRTDEWNRKISESHIGEKNPCARRIVLVDNEYNLIKEYGCIKYAADELDLSISRIQSVCEHKSAYTGGYVFMYYSEYVEMEQSGAKPERVEIKPYRKQINQLTLDGKFIQKFNSIKQAAREIGGDSKGISQACRGLLKTSGGFKWEFAETNNELKEKNNYGR